MKYEVSCCIEYRPVPRHDWAVFPEPPNNQFPLGKRLEMKRKKKDAEEIVDGDGAGDADYEEKTEKKKKKKVKSKTKPKPSMRPLKNPPPMINIGDLATYSVGSDSYGCRVSAIRDRGRELDLVRHEPGGGTNYGRFFHVVTWRKTGIWYDKGETIHRHKSVRFGSATTNLDPGF